MLPIDSVAWLLTMRKILLTIVSMICAACAWGAVPAAHHAPDLDKIKAESIDPKSKHYYDKLMKDFLSNDTIMNDEDFEYFYYGTLFQEDFNPYREPYDAEAIELIKPLYSQSKHTRAELDRMKQYAEQALADNPLDLIQLRNLIFVYEKLGKVNLAKIWKNKLNHLLHTIASSGTGIDEENAWYVVYPRHEFDLLNITGIVVNNTEFVEPYYEKITVTKKSDKDPDAYYFNIRPVLEQYYLKHPSEAD